MATINSNGTMVFGNSNGGSVTIAPKNDTAKNYTITIPDTSGSVVLGESIGRRNYLINGNFDKWDYATSQTSNNYGSDNRWLNGSIGSSKTHSQVACGNTERALFNAMYFSRTDVGSVNGANNYVQKEQKIENVNLLAGKTVTLSFWAKADANRNIAIGLYQMFGTGGSPSSPVGGIGTQLVALTTTWQKKTITVAIPSIVGKTLGTDGANTTYTALDFWFDAGANYASSAASLGQQSGTFDIAQVKIEDGLVATAGWHPYDGEFGGEMQACARYYEVGSVQLTGVVYTNGDNRNWMDFLVVKRVAPTISLDNSSLSVICAGNGGAINYAVTVNAITSTVTGWRIFTLGNANNMNSANGTQAAAWGNMYITTYYASAEL
ncbi:MAG: hypothetical protein JHC33_09135 [Ignisphaera sp.]|nr:hypothetical protein [Ignisphaera sp.]